MKMEYEDLNDEQRAFLTDGCGNHFLNVPDLAFGEACRKHDFGYWLGHTSGDRRRVDKQWYMDMLTAANKFSWWTRWYLKAAAWVYYKSVRTFSWRWFNFSERYKTFDDLEVEMLDAQV